MQKISVLVLLVSVGLLGWSQTAEARFQRVTQVPNGVTYNCTLCHVNAAGGPDLVPFGQQANESLSIPGATGKVDWATLYNLDADGDGFTNGAELGDPAGAWVEGDPNPELISDPTDAQSTPDNGGDVNNDTNNGAGNNGTPDETPDGGGDSGDDEDGCSVSPGRTSGGVLGSLLVLMGLALLRRRS